MNIQETSIQRLETKNEEQESQMSKVRLKIGQQPFYIEPKINNSSVGSQPDMISETDQNSMQIPKFHSPSINESMVFTNINQNQIKEEKVQQTCELPQSKEIKFSLKFIIIQLIIWLLYFIGSIENSYSQITAFHIIDCIGNGISLVSTIYSIYSNKSLKSVSQILHIWSILLTITFLAYPKSISEKSQSDHTFIKIINILRSLRLLFPLLNRKIEIEKIKKVFFNIYKLRKILLFALFWLFFIGMICYQLFADSEWNRCRSFQIPQTLEQMTPIDNRLCGQRTCPLNSFCTNPKRIELKISQEQKQLKKDQLKFFSFDSSLQSMFSVFQIFTLNRWGNISQTYFDIYPGVISVPIYILGFIVFQILIFSLILVFFQIHKQEKERLDPLIRKIPQNRFSFNPQKYAVEDIKLDVNDNSVYPLGSYKTFAINKSILVSYEDQKEKLEQKQQNKFTHIAKYILYSILILYSIGHYVLASQFGLKPISFNDDLENRKIGIILIIFFIIHFIALNLIKFQFLDSKQQDKNDNFMESKIQAKIKDEKKQSQEQIIGLIMKFEYFIFFISLADYLFRIIERKYVIEQSSCLTPFFHFLLSLRFYYFFMALADIFHFISIKKHIMLVIKTIESGSKFVLIFLIFACILGIISFIINDKNYEYSKITTGFIFEINQILMFLVNHSWQQLRNSPFSSDTKLNSLYIEIIRGFCLFLGSIIFFSYYVAYLVNEALRNNTSEPFQVIQNQSNNDKYIIKNEDNTPSQQKKIQQNEEIQSLKQQSNFYPIKESFYIFSYENTLRQYALTIVKDKYYQQTIRFRFYLIYLLIVILSLCFGDNKSYGIISTVLEGFVFLDIMMTALALRFFGKFSYCQNKSLPILHFIACFIIIIFSLTQQYQQNSRQFQINFVPFLQISRTLLIFNYFQSFQKTFIFIQKLCPKIILNFLILIPILLGYTLISLLLLSAQNEQLLFSQKLLESLKISLIFFTQKGWNLSLIVRQSNFSTIFGQLSILALLIIWIVISVSFYCSLTGIILFHLVQQKKNQEQQLKQTLCDSNLLLQEVKIKQRIQKMKPKFDFRVYGSGFLLKLCKQIFFQIIKKICCIFCFICYIAVNVDLSTQQRVAVYSIHLFLFTIEILMFIMESFCYKCNQNNFWRDLILNLLSIPGSYIGFANPVRYSNQSHELKVILQFFNALTILRFFKILSYFQVFRKITELILVKLSKTFHILAILIVLAIVNGCYLFLIFGRKQPILNCFNYAFLGLMGGDFHSSIQTITQRNQFQFTYQLHFVYLIVHLSSQIFYSLLIAFFIFQVSETVKQATPFRKTEFHLHNFNKYFHENQFLDQWEKIDPQGKGYVNFKIILLKSHLFIRHFSVSILLYKSFQNRVQTFKKLNLQIFEAQTSFLKQQNLSEVRKEYVVTFYDFLFSLNKFIFKEINSPKLIDKGGFFIKNEYYNEQPISFFNINSGGFEMIMNGLRQDDKAQKKSQELNERWRKQSYSLVKQIMKQRLQQHPQIEGINSILKSTNIKSQDLFYAYRVKGKIMKLLKDIKICNFNK